MPLASTEIRRPLRLVDGGSDESGLIIPTTTLAAESSNLRNQRDKDRLTGVLMADRVLGRNSWKWFNAIGEIHYALTRAARIAGYAKIRAVRLTPDGKVDSTIDTGPVADLVASFYSRVGGTRHLIERYFLQQKVPGESHLIRWMEGRSQDGYVFASSQELDDGTVGVAGATIAAKAQKMDLKMTTQPAVANINGAFTKSIAQKDYIGRVWAPSAQWLEVPESPLFALDTQCDILHSMTRQMRATLKSRFAVAGLLYFSSQVREAFGGAGRRTPRGKTVLQIIYEIMKTNLADGGDLTDVTSILPIMLMGDAEVGKVAEHITIDRQIFETDINLRSELIDRILFGLDINAPSTKGNTDTSHWGAWQNSADELRLAVIPELEGFCWAAWRLVVLPGINALGGNTDLKADANAGRIGVSFELDEASVKANRAADARELRKAGLLAGLPALRASGFKDEDMLVGAEYVRVIGELLRIPKLACYGLDQWDSIDWEDPALAAGGKTGRIGTGAGDEKSGPGEGDPGSPDDSDSDTPKNDKPI
jgi:hypothetical protein